MHLMKCFYSLDGKWYIGLLNEYVRWTLICQIIDSSRCCFRQYSQSFTFCWSRFRYLHIFGSEAGCLPLKLASTIQVGMSPVSVLHASPASCPYRGKTKETRDSTTVAR